MKRNLLSILTAITVVISLSACQAGDTRQEVELIDEQMNHGKFKNEKKSKKMKESKKIE